jgi:hypothetical protein
MSWPDGYAATESIADPLLTALGFWPRFLAAWPAPQAPRLARQFRPDLLPPVARYWTRCTELLAEPLGEDADQCPVLPLSDDASELLARAFERFEHASRRGGLRSIKPFGLRAAEQACRVAGVLAAFGGQHAVTREVMAGALALVTYSLDTWQSLIDEGAADQRAAHALRLFEWLTQRPCWSESLAVIVNAGPPCVRSKDKRDAAVATLELAGLVTVAGGRVLVADVEATA